MIEHAIKIAARSPMQRYGSGCVIVRGKKVISTGWSHKGMNLGSLYSLHAELHALARAKHLDLKGANCYIATLSKKSGNITTATPCLRCAIALQAAGIEWVHYTLPNGLRPLPRKIEWLVDLKVYEAPNGSHQEYI